MLSLDEKTSVGRPPLRFARELLPASLAFWAACVTYDVYVRAPQELAYPPHSSLMKVAVIVMIGGTLGLMLTAALRRATCLAFSQQAVLTALLAIAAGAVMNATLAISGMLGKQALGPALFRLDEAFSIVSLWLPKFALWTAISLAIVHHEGLRAQEQRVSTLRLGMKKAQLRALRYQVDPHLLYNTLNSVAALILDRRNDAAERMVLRLSDFFRVSSAVDPLADVPLKDEIALQKLYLEIVRTEFDDRIAIEMDISKEAADACVPSLILLPLTENAVKHGLRHRKGDATLRIVARRENDELLIDVANTGAEASGTPGTGIGLANVRARLAMRFGGAARMKTQALPGEGFAVRLAVPYLAA